MKRASVIGAGVFGLAAATELAERGFEVTLYERNPGLGGNASWLAGGMLAPYCEGESAPWSVVERGLAAVEWWTRHVPDVAHAGTLVVAPPRDAPDLERFAARTQGWERLDGDGVAKLEPDLAGRFQRGLYYSDEGLVDPRQAMDALCQRLIARGVDLRFAHPFREEEAKGVVIDCRGWAARDALAELRGVRGEMLLVRTKEVRLSRPVRLLHPRIPLYVAPRADGLFMIGATMIESGEKGGMTVRSAIELLSAAFALHPAFGEADIIEMSADVRPAFADNEPRVVEKDGRLYLNGAYRHGWLLAPDMAVQAADRALQMIKPASIGQRLVENAPPIGDLEYPPRGDGRPNPFET